MINDSEREAFFKLIDCSAGANACWPWIGARNAQGYGSWRGHTGERRAYRPHRLAKALAEGRDMPHWRVYCCHTCDNPSCCNPAHLYFGTPAENVADKFKRERSWQQAVLHCPAGHAYEASHSGKKRRRCLECERAAAKTPEGREKARLKAAAWRAANPDKVREIKARYRTQCR